MDNNFRKMAADEIDRFRREIIERTGDIRQAENLTDQTLREVMNTVGKEGRWANQFVVSYPLLCFQRLGCQHCHPCPYVRAFGTQLLCEQVIGRALRRQSYDST